MGAGISAPFGFPTGQGLKDQVSGGHLNDELVLRIIFPLFRYRPFPFLEFLGPDLPAYPNQFARKKCVIPKKEFFNSASSEYNTGVSIENQNIRQLT